MRKPIRNYVFEGTKISLRKGQTVIIPIYAIQHDPNIYPDPDVFDPERFSAENMEQRNSMYYLPFGDGPRNCIGNLKAYKFMSYCSRYLFYFLFLVYNTYIRILNLKNIEMSCALFF